MAAAITAVFVVTLLLAVLPRAHEALAAPDLPPGFGDCVPGNCPDDRYPDPSPDAGELSDDAVNVFAGGDFRVVGGAAEAEGRVVVLADVAVDRAVDGVYQIGAVGVGSQVAPPDGAVALEVGGVLSVAGGETLALDGDPARDDVVEHAGALSGTVTAGTISATDDAVAEYEDAVLALQAVSRCAASQETTGGVVNEGFRSVFTGDGTSDLQVFEVDGDLANPDTGASQDLVFEDVPTDATVIVNVIGGPRRLLRPTTISGVDRERLLWNFADASTVRIDGRGVVDGSVLVADDGSETFVEVPALNGRVYVTGDLEHGGSGGTALHAYPFRGVLAECGPPPTTTTTTDPSVPRATFPSGGGPSTIGGRPPTRAPGASSTTTSAPPPPGGPPGTPPAAATSTTSTTSPTSTTTPQTLPATGTTGGSLVMPALALIGAGALLVLAGRRRPCD